MKMRHKGTRLRTEVDNFIRQQIRLDRTDAITLNAFHAVKRLNELEKGFARAAPKIAGVNAGQHNFFSAFGRHGFSLTDERRNRPVAASTSGERNRAIRAIIVASVLHFEKVSRAIAFTTRRHERAYVSRGQGYGGVDVFSLLQGLTLSESFLDIAHDVSLLLHSNDQVDARKAGYLFRL